MSAGVKRCFDARTEPCASLRAWLEIFCANSNTAKHTTWQLTLVLEELFVNTAKHGYADCADAAATWPVWVELSSSGASVHVIYEDAGVAFNPLENIQLPDYSGPPDTWRIGGLGLPMITGIARDLIYEHTAGHNRITLTVPAGETLA